MAGEWSHLSQLYNFEVNLMQIHKNIEHPTDAWPSKLCHFLVLGRSNFTVEFQYTNTWHTAEAGSNF